MAHRQAALPRYVLERHTAVEVSVENFFGASLLPRRGAAPRRARYRPHAAIRLSDMNSDRQGDGVNKQPVGLVGMPKRRQRRAAEAENRGIVDALAGLIVQITNSRRVDVISNGVQRRAGQIKMHRMIGLVEDSDGISFQVANAHFTGSQVAHWRSLAVFPIFMTGKIAQVQTDQKRVFPLE